MFSSDDLNFAKGLKKILDEGTFPLMVKEVSAFAQIVTWAGNLELRIKKDIADKKMSPVVPKKKAKK